MQHLDSWVKFYCDVPAAADSIGNAYVAAILGYYGCDPFAVCHSSGVTDGPIFYRSLSVDILGRGLDVVGPVDVNFTIFVVFGIVVQCLDILDRLFKFSIFGHCLLRE